MQIESKGGRGANKQNLSSWKRPRELLKKCHYIHPPSAGEAICSLPFSHRSAAKCSFFPREKARMRVFQQAASARSPRDHESRDTPASCDIPPGGTPNRPKSVYPC